MFQPTSMTRLFLSHIHNFIWDKVYQLWVQVLEISGMTSIDAYAFVISCNVHKITTFQINCRLSILDFIPIASYAYVIGTR